MPVMLTRTFSRYLTKKINENSTATKMLVILKFQKYIFYIYNFQINGCLKNYPIFDIFSGT